MQESRDGAEEEAGRRRKEKEGGRGEKIAGGSSISVHFVCLDGGMAAFLLFFNVPSIAIIIYIYIYIYRKGS